MRAVSRMKLRRWFEQSPQAVDMLPLAMATGVGLATGLGSYIFIWLLEHITDFAETMRDESEIIGGLGILMIAGLLTGIIISRFASEAKGHGVPEVMEAIALRRGRIRPRVAVAKIVASSITIGAGGSAGREGPIVQVGSALGSTVGQWARLSDEQVGMLVASGAAAGIAAAFNAPIAGAMFALEVILGRFTNRYLGMVVISAVSANVVSRALLGEAPAFQVPAYPLNSPLELPLYIVLGVLCGLGALLFIRTLYRAEAIFDGWAVPLPVRTTVGMGLTGVTALLAPDVLGPGLEFIGDAIADDVSLAFGTMIGLLFLKLAATIFTLGAGNSGGVFAPGLFMGAMIGGIVGQVGHELWPSVVIDPGAFALVGMAALFAGSARAPITAIIIVLEMSNDYRLIVPLMTGVVISTLLTDLLHPETIYTLKLTLRGIRLQRGQDVDVLQGVTVEEVMTIDYGEVNPDTTLIEAIEKFNHTHHHGFPIVDTQRQLCGIITLTDIEHAQEEGIPFETPVIEIGSTSNLITVYPDDPMYVALRRMNIYHVGRLPVVSRERANVYIGMIRRDDILRAYDIGLARKAIEQHRQARYKLRNIENSGFVEVEVVPDAPMVGRTLFEFPYSDQCLVLAVRREGQTMIARGRTRIEPGDTVTIYATEDVRDAVCAQFTSSAVAAPELELSDSRVRGRLDTLTGERVQEVRVGPKSAIVGKQVRDVPWPQEAVIAAVRRNRHIILPHGNTSLLAGDTLIMVVEPGVEDQLHALVAENLTMSQG